MSYLSRIFKNLGAALVAGALGFSVLPCAHATQGQTNGTASLQGNRYLIIVESSRAMDKRLDGVTRTIDGLLASGFNGQVHYGDSLGLWTYNDQLHTGQFPLQELSPDNFKSTSASISTFLKRQKFEKQPEFDRVLPSLGLIVTNSYLLTVVILCSGTGDIHGTPFDDAINAEFKQWRLQQQNQRMPFVVLLRGYRGQLTKFAVAAAPWPLDIPALPVETPVVNVAQAKPAAPAPKMASANLIVSGKKAAPRPVGPATNPAPGNVESAASAPSIVAQIPDPQLTQTPPRQQSTTLPAGPSVAAEVAKKNPEPLPTPSATLVASPTAKVPPTAGPEPAKALPEPRKVSPPELALAPTNPNLSEPKTNSNAAVAPAKDPDISTPSVATAMPEPLKSNSRPPISKWLTPEVIRGAEYAAAGLLFLCGFVFLLAQRRKARERASRPISLITRSLDRQYERQ